MQTTERTYFESGQILSLSSEKEGGTRTQFKIRSLVGEGGAAVCYHVEMIRDGYQKTGKLKEFYPLAKAGDGYRLIRQADGQLIAEGDASAFIAWRDAYPETTRILWQVMNNPEYELLRNYIQMGEVYYGTDESATIYIWTPGVIGEELEDYLQTVRERPERQPEVKLRNILRVMISLTNCMQALHTAGIMHLDIKPANFIIPYAGNGEINPDHISMFDIDTLYSIQNEVDTRFVGSTGYCAPEVRRGMADNRSDIYSIGAVLFRAIVIDKEIDDDGIYLDEYYENLGVLVKNSQLIAGSVRNSDRNLVGMLANILKKCLAADPEKRYERCGELLAALKEALQRSVLTEGKQQMVETEIDDIPETPIQKLLYEHPLYESLPLSLDQEEEKKTIQVLVAGAGTHGQKFMDLCLQAGQMRGHSLSITVISDNPEEDKKNYLQYRPDIHRFVDIDGSMSDHTDLAYGSMRFLPIVGADGETRFFRGEGSEAQRKNQALVSDLILLAEESGESYNYIFVALGDDALNFQVACFFADANFDLHDGKGCPIGYVWEGDEKSNRSAIPGGTYPVYVNKRITSAHIDSQLEQMAFNTHLSWANALNPDLMGEFQKFRSDRYNYNASLAYALSLKYKLYSVGILFEGDRPLLEAGERFHVVKDPLEAARVFSEEVLFPQMEGDKEAKEKFDALVSLEHRRWVLEKVTDGWRAPLDKNGKLNLNECVAKRKVKNPSQRTHPCIVFSSEQTPLKDKSYSAGNRSKWNDPNIDPCLDELDRMSVELHQCFHRKAEQIRSENAAYQSDMDAIWHLINGKEESISVACRKFDFCLHNILEGVESYTRQYSHFKQAFLDSLDGLPEDDKQEIVKRVELIDQAFFPVVEDNLYRNYKENDEVLIRKIPFILSYRSVSGIVMAFEDGKLQNGKNEALFANVASATVLCPQNISFLYLYERDAEPEFLANRISSALNYLRDRKIHCKVSITIACLNNVDEKEKKQLTKRVEKLRKEEQQENVSTMLSQCDLIFCVDRQEVAECFLERVQNANDFLYDGSTALFHSVLEDGNFIRRVREMNVPYFEFDWRKKVFTQHIDCDFLQYIEDSSFIRVDDMFSLMKATDNRTDLPDFMGEYERLWGIYTGGKGVSQSKFEKSVRTWNHLCALLEEYDNAQRQKDILQIHENDTVESMEDCLDVSHIALNQNENWYPEPMYELLENLQAEGCIKQLEQALDNPWIVSFEYAAPRFKHLLTSAGEILEIYAYYEVLKTGYFDDVATGFEFNWDEGGVKNELDLVLTKGFRSIIVECKAVQKLDLNYYHKLHSLAEHFGIGTIKVLLGNTYKQSNEDINEVNKMQRSRGSQLHIRTFYGQEKIENIGETLKRMMEEEI